MGYESRLYVVEKTNVEADGMKYARIICMFDMGKFYPLSDILRDEPKTDCYIYSDDGNTRITEDRYGEALTETDLKTVIGILRGFIAKGQTRRDIPPLLEYLKTLSEQQRDSVWRDVAVLHYGY